MIKRIFKIHSKLPKYAVVYDPDIVLQYAKSLLMRYRCISATNFWISIYFFSGQWSQSFGRLKINKSIFNDRACTFYIDSIQETIKSGKQ